MEYLSEFVKYEDHLKSLPRVAPNPVQVYCQ